MCPVVLFALISSFILFLLEVTAALSVTFAPSKLTVKEEESKSLLLSFSQFDKSVDYYDYELNVLNPVVAEVDGNRWLRVNTSHDVYNATVRVKGKFLGFTYLNLKPKDDEIRNTSAVRRSPAVSRANEKQVEIPVIVTLKDSLLSNIFTISIAVLVSLNYINMGCALDMSVVKQVLKKPIAPSVGFFSQYLIMPLTSYVVGYFLLSESFLKFGLFTFGTSPSGGASNIWTVLFGGNLNLSITMTFITTLCAVFVMPMWLFTLGKTIYGTTSIKIPFQNIVTTLVSMTCCLGIGLLFQRFLPRLSEICRRLLTPLSVCMVIYIIIFGTYANWFMFKYMNWRILISAGLNVWIGFLLGVACSAVFRLPMKDLIAVALETGIQNTGVSIVLLRLSLPEPDRDLSTVVPVAAAIMTPLPLFVILLYNKIMQRVHKKGENVEEFGKGDNESIQKIQSNNSITSPLVSDIPAPNLPPNYSVIS